MLTRFLHKLTHADIVKQNIALYNDNNSNNTGNDVKPRTTNMTRIVKLYTHILTLNSTSMQYHPMLYIVYGIVIHHGYYHAQSHHYFIRYHN